MIDKSSLTPFSIQETRRRLWEQRLKRVFKIDRLTCEHCGGAVKVIASMEDSVVIKQILAHLERRAAPAMPVFRPFACAAAANGTTGPEGIRLTVLFYDLRMDARLG